jgi:PAS domain S-box-containing protein
MSKKPTYEELEERNKELEKKAYKHRQAEEALRESERGYRIFAETIPHGIQEIDTSGVITFANDAYYSLMGYENDELLGKAIWDLIEFETASGKEELQEYLRLLIKDQPSPTPYFQKHWKTDGKVIEAQVDWNYKRNEQGLVTGFISVLTDITERKRAKEELKRSHDELEQRVKERTADLTKSNERLKQEIEERKQAEDALRESEEKYRLLVETMSDGLGIQDKNGLITYVNDKFCKMLNCKPDEFVGRPVDYFLDERNKQILREQIYKRRKDEVQSYELEWTGRDGNQIPTIMSPQAIFDEKGDFKGSFAVITDISDRKQAEESLRKQTHDLDERVKELNCFYGISKIREKPDIAFEEMLQEIVELIPPSWQYPKITCVRIIIEGQEYKTKNFKETVWKQTSNIVVHGQRIGILEICYLEEKPESDEGPFQKEERSLINAIAERLGRVTEHKWAERALRKAHDELEHRVKERTRELEIKKNSLEEINTAMKVLLKKREEDKTELEDNVLTNVKELISPYFEKIKKTKLDGQQEAFLSIIESYLNEIISPFTRKMSLKYLNLTPTEIQIANLVKHGSATKKIAELMNISPRTVETHRKNIRRKIGLKAKKANLRSHLLSLH